MVMNTAKHKGFAVLSHCQRRSFTSGASWRIPKRGGIATTGRHTGFAKRTTRPKPSHESSNENTSQSRPPTRNELVSHSLQTSSEDLNLLAPVHVPNDPNSVLPPEHPCTNILANSSIVVQRQLEMMNVMIGFEQANKYIIMDGHGNTIGYLAEQEHGLGNAIARQTFRTHRSFTTHVFDRNEVEVLRFHRPFSWVSSRIRVYDAASATATYGSSNALSGTSAGSALSNASSAQISTLPLDQMRMIGEAQQQWAPLRRKYNLFLHRPLNTPDSQDRPQLASGDLPLSTSTSVQAADPTMENVGFAQFAYVDEPFLSWDFSLKDQQGGLIGSVNRNFSGFARELFTDTGVYALRMDSAGLTDTELDHSSPDSAVESKRGMTLDQRAMMLATAVSVDFDYFSRQRHGAFGGFMPLWFPIPGGGVAAAETGAEAEATEGAAAGAGTLAGYDAMRGSQASDQSVDDMSPQAGSSDQGFWGGLGDQNQSPGQAGQDPWGAGNDPWGGGSAGNVGGSGSGNSGGGSGDGGSFFDDFF